MKSNVTFTASIYIGTRHGYSDDKYSSIDDIRQWLQEFCNDVLLGVTLTATEFIYVGGNEPGVIVGLINYPRFPKPIKEIKENARAIAKGLMELCEQERVSIVFSDETIILEKTNEI
jgi:hypothetical protein